MNTQRNSQNRKSLVYFKLVDEAAHIYSCTIDNCGKLTKGKNLGNLVSHLKHLHINIYKENINPVADDPKSIELKRLDLLQACAEIVTVNGRPLKCLTDSGFQLAIRDKLRELEENGRGLAIDRNNFEEVKAYIKQSGKTILERIRDEVKTKLVSVMTDIGSKNDRSILGTHIRYIANNKVVTRNVGMTLIVERHTSTVLKKVILGQLSKVDLGISQIIAFTTDNARNMTATARLIDSEINAHTSNDEEEQEEDEQHSEDEEEHDALNLGILRRAERHDEIDEQLETILDDADIEAETERNLEAEFAGQTLNVNRIPCSAHTLQLAVKTFLESENVKPLVSLSRLVAIELRKPASVYDLQADNIHVRKVRIDCPTRWSSVHCMVI